MCTYLHPTPHGVQSSMSLSTCLQYLKGHEIDPFSVENYSSQSTARNPKTIKKFGCFNEKLTIYSYNIVISFL